MARRPNLGESGGVVSDFSADRSQNPGWFIFAAVAATAGLISCGGGGWLWWPK